MASDGTAGKIPTASLVQGSRAQQTISLSPGGNSLPSSGKNAAAGKAVVPQTSDPQELVQNLNRFLNDSGQPDQFKLAPESDGKLIQQINPATGAVVGEFSAAEFPALARSVGVPGLLVDSLA